MIKYITLVCLLLILNSFKGGNNLLKLNGPDTDTSKVAITISPVRPLIEKDIYGYYMNFDITIKNQTTHTIELSSVEASVMDKTGKLVLRKFMNSHGKAPGIDLLVYTTIKPGETVNVFNPFHTFPPDLTIASVKYGFFFNYADTQEEVNNNKNRLPVDFDASVIKVITPQVYIAKNDYFLPLKGKIIVWDGHDFYSRNRRSSTDIADPKVKEITSNSSRYAYDLMNVDGNGSMYGGSPYKKENWYSYGKPVYVPLDGKIIAIQNNIPDNEYNGKTVKSPKSALSADPDGMGNYVIIQHANGEYSMLLHLEAGSIKVRPGQMVKEGDELGSVGFSGQAMYPHLHYSVTNGAKELASEGLPNYFNNYKLYRGNVTVNIKRSRIDSGDIVESEK
ncbi:putative peptidase [mine drainage metagenome]|uniref:Putative peptidase n=1 Tax=mine drainage metagenome TaxID=410659 RepID=A0A1J5Q3K0_9ZZZZ